MLKQNQGLKTLKLWQKCTLTFFVLVIYRILCSIPTPGVNKDYFDLLVNANAALGFLNIFTGNNLSSLSIMALNIAPYISATIVIQLLEPSIEVLKRLSRGTPKDKKKVSIITFVLTAIFAMAQAIGMAVAFGRDGLLVEYSFFWVALVVVIWTSAAVLLAIAGKAMEDKKNLFVGRGISLFLFTNILSSTPLNIKEIYQTFIMGQKYEILWCFVGVLSLFVLFAVISCLCSIEKRIVVSYTSNIVYEKLGQSTLKQILPIKLMPASVMPVIFTSTIFSIPVLIASVIGHQGAEWVKYLDTNMWFNVNSPVYSVGCLFFVALIFAFSYLYVNVFLNPYEIAEDLQKAGGFINNLKTNTETAKYLKKHILQMATLGSIVLSVISVVPFVLNGLFGLSQTVFLGTSVLIVTSVILETYKDILATKIIEDHKRKAGGLLHG